jgi:hypothetical protein
MSKFLLVYSFFFLIFLQALLAKEKPKIVIPKHDSLVVQNEVILKVDPKVEEKQNFLEKNMAWVAAIIVGVLTTAGTIYIGVHQKRSNESSLEKQMQKNSEQLDKQMQLSIDLQKVQYRNTLAATNRQEWINDLRITISEFLSKATIIFINKRRSNENSDSSTTELEKLIYLKNKIELLLNIEHQEQKQVRDAIWNILNEVEKSDLTLNKLSKLQEKVISSSSTLFQMQWEKIKSSE